MRASPQTPRNISAAAEGDRCLYTSGSLSHDGIDFRVPMITIFIEGGK